MSKPFFSLILPVRDEAERLLDVLTAADYVLSLSEFSSEIIVVDDGSRDVTRGIAERFGKAVRPVRIIEGKEHHGIGWATQEGLVVARGNVRCVMDLSCVSFLGSRVEIIDVLRRNQGIVIAVSHTHTQPLRRSIAWIVKIVRRLFRAPKNSHGILHARPYAFCISEEAAKYLLQFPHFSLREGIFREFLILANRAHIPIEVMYSIAYEHSQRSLYRPVSFYWDMLVVWWKERKNFYILPKKTECI
ncbi:MAG: glycosyltransferase family 2 protein [Candidatus Paceibacterota bacterium]|jgi:glycosyltransferase involved in cell wall biosynthesis